MGFHPAGKFRLLARSRAEDKRQNYRHGLRIGDNDFGSDGIKTATCFELPLVKAASSSPASVFLRKSKMMRLFASIRGMV